MAWVCRERNRARTYGKNGERRSSKESLTLTICMQQTGREEKLSGVLRAGEKWGNGVLCRGKEGNETRGKPGAVANEVVTEDKRRRKAWEGEVGEERSQAWTGGTDAAFIGVPRVPNGRSCSRYSHVPGPLCPCTWAPQAAPCSENMCSLA